MSSTNSVEKAKYLCEPCRNFCIFAALTINDPKDGKEKIVLSSLAHGSKGIIIFIDPDSGEGEYVTQPADDGAWALFNLNDEKLLVGTCGSYGYLHILDLKTRTWGESLKDPNESYIWNLAMGSDGKVYGGTWPGCVLLRYDPEMHVMENMGRASDNTKNMYSRMVYGGVPGYMLISIGCEEPHVATYSIEKGTFGRLGRSGGAVREITDEFICISYANEGQLEFYDPKSFELLDASIYTDKLKKRDSRLMPAMGHELELQDGRLAGTRGQEYFIYEKDSAEPVLKPIPVEAPATGIMTLTAGPDNKIWGATSLGQTIFWYDPETGEYLNTQIVTNVGGEVYGMKFIGNKLYLSSYSGGDHMVYDITQPWSQIDNVNPKTLETVRPELIRPTGRSIQGPDGNFWTGWGAKYGTYGGGLTRINVNTEKLDCWYDPIEGWHQTIGSISCDDRYIYFTTNGGASGLATKTEPFFLAAFDPFEGRVVKKVQFETGNNLGTLQVTDGYISVAVNNEIQVYKCGSLEYAGTVNTGSRCSWMTQYDEKRVIAFCKEKAYVVTPATLSAEFITDFEGTVRAGTVMNGKIYFSVETKLFVFDLAKGGN